MKPYYRFKNYDLKKNGSLFIWLKGKYLFIYFIEVFIEKKIKQIGSTITTLILN